MTRHANLAILGYGPVTIGVAMILVDLLQHV